MLPTLLTSKLTSRSGTIGWIMVTVLGIACLAVVGLLKLVF